MTTFTDITVEARVQVSQLTTPCGLLILTRRIKTTFVGNRARIPCVKPTEGSAIILN